MNTLTIKTNENLNARLKAAASRRGLTKSAMARKAIEDYLEKEAEVRPGSCLDLVKDLVGMYEGPRDLSSNPKHLKGFGK